MYMIVRVSASAEFLKSSRDQIFSTPGSLGPSKRVNARNRHVGLDKGLLFTILYFSACVCRQQIRVIQCSNFLCLIITNS